MYFATSLYRYYLVENNNQLFYKRSLQIPKRYSESVNRRRTDNTMQKTKRTKEQTTFYKILHIKLKINGELSMCTEPEFSRENQDFSCDSPNGYALITTSIIFKIYVCWYDNVHVHALLWMKPWKKEFLYELRGKIESDFVHGCSIYIIMCS